MKRWVVVALVLLAALILVSPGIVGHLAERNLQDSIRWAENERGDLLVTEEAFERGWFTTDGRHRVELKHGTLRSRLLKVTGGDAQQRIPALIVDTRIDHGLVPFTSMSREAGSLMPALASTVSSLQLDIGEGGDGELIDIPGTLTSQIGLSGATASRYLLEPGSFESEAWGIEWQDADISVTTDASQRELAYDATIKPVSLRSGNRTVELGQTSFRGDARYAGFGFMVGSVLLELDGLSVDGSSPGAVSGGGGGEHLDIGELRLDASSEIVGERVGGRTTLTIADFSVPDFGDLDLALEISAHGVDASSLQGIIAGLQAAQRAPEPDAALAALYPRIEGDLQRLLAAGAELRIDRFDVTLPQGVVTTSLHLQLPQGDPRGDFSWAALLLALSASADLRVPVALMELAQAANPQSGALIAMGILKRDGDAYVVDAKYRKGLLTVNGAPMPIPLPLPLPGRQGGAGEPQSTGQGPGN
jgi:uncharacterized protein YdgA (DUF945 family)